VIDPAQYVAATQEYLRVTAERLLDESRAFLAGKVEFIFPNGRFDDIADVFAAGERRYRWIRKQHDSWDVVEKDDGTVVVVSVGTLYGENLAGKRFSDVRYVDRITYRGDRIVRQQVWNDLVESRVLELEPGSSAGDQGDQADRQEG
jgi:hypothetical protein